MFSLASVEDVASDALAPDESLARFDRTSKIRAAIDALPEKHRRVVLLTELSELSYEEVAGVVGIPIGTVASRRSHALAKLRNALGDLEEDAHVV